ncbi:MAG TPA: hypothetical protein PKZ14_04495, partial [Chitinophagales bacterium]|nr:hypothetical protein [Chitinophagales bacterium]
KSTIYTLINYNRKIHFMVYKKLDLSNSPAVVGLQPTNFFDLSKVWVWMLISVTAQFNFE